MDSKPWYRSDDPSTVVRGATWRGLVWVLAVSAVVAVVSVAAWGFGVATSDVKGRGDAERTVNDADNRLAQQAYFEQTYADVRAADRKLTALAQDAAAHPSDAEARTRLVGAENYCQGLVGDYEAAARKQSAARFRAADLPAQIDQEDAATDCRPAPVASQEAVK